ncbi:Methyltransferase type 11 domain protein, partial [mine drainage metagenome]
MRSVRRSGLFRVGPKRKRNALSGVGPHMPTPRPSRTSLPAWTTYRTSWDRMQERYVPEREDRFAVMGDILTEALPRSARILDLGTGLGSLAERLARRMPSAQIVAVDHDPVLLRIARESLAGSPARIQWVDLDLRTPQWAEALPRGRYDAVVSTTALHWLRRPDCTACIAPC